MFCKYIVDNFYFLFYCINIYLKAFKNIFWSPYILFIYIFIYLFYVYIFFQIYFSYKIFFYFYNIVYISQKC